MERESIVDIILEEVYKRKMTLYKLSKITGIKYELLRRVFVGGRKLVASELITIAEAIDFDLNLLKRKEF